MSISGGDTRSGFKKRSKNKPYRIGSMSGRRTMLSPFTSRSAGTSTSSKNIACSGDTNRLIAVSQTCRVDSGDADTVVSRSITGKPARMIRSKWADAWVVAGKEPLPMPYQSMIAGPVMASGIRAKRKELDDGGFVLAQKAKLIVDAEADAAVTDAEAPDVPDAGAPVDAGPAPDAPTADSPATV